MYAFSTLGGTGTPGPVLHDLLQKYRFLLYKLVVKSYADGVNEEYEKECTISRRKEYTPLSLKVLSTREYVQIELVRAHTDADSIHPLPRRRWASRPEISRPWRYIVRFSPPIGQLRTSSNKISLYRTHRPRHPLPRLPYLARYVASDTVVLLRDCWLAQAIPFSFLCAEWFCTAYVRNTPLPLAMCAIDLFLVRMDDIMIRLGVAILEVNSLRTPLDDMGTQAYQIAVRVK